MRSATQGWGDVGRAGTDSIRPPHTRTAGDRTRPRGMHSNCPLGRRKPMILHAEIDARIIETTPQKNRERCARGRPRCAAVTKANRRQSCGRPILPPRIPNPADANQLTKAPSSIRWPALLSNLSHSLFAATFDPAADTLARSAGKHPTPEGQRATMKSAESALTKTFGEIWP